MEASGKKMTCAQPPEREPSIPNGDKKEAAREQGRHDGGAAVRAMLLPSPAASAPGMTGSDACNSRLGTC